MVRVEVNKEDALKEISLLRRRISELENRVASLKSQQQEMHVGRIRVVDELREGEKNLKPYLDNAPDGVCIYDLKGAFLYGNNKAEEILGYKKDEVLGKSFLDLDLLHPNDVTRAGELIAVNARGMSTGPDEFELKRKDRSLRWVEMTTTPIKEKETILVLNFIRDITERKIAEEEIKESRARFRDLAKLLPLAVWETDERGFLTYTNDETMRTYGYSPDDTIPIRYLQNLVPEDRDRAAQNVERIMKGEALGGIEYTAVRKDGSTFPARIYASAILKNGIGVGIRGITVNITGQKTAEKRLEQAAQDWRVTFDSLTDMVCILDSDFKITRLNRAFANVLGREPRDLLGTTCYEMLHKVCPHTDCPHQKTLLTSRPARAEFYEPFLKTYIEVSTSPIFNNEGKVHSSVHIIRDISEQKQMEQQLMLTDRLASVGELASGVAHELNNPLTSVIGFSQLLMEGEIPAAIKEDLALINSEAQRAATIVKNLLTFARKHAAVKQPTRINNLIEEVLKLRAYEQKVNNIEVIKNLALDIPEMMLDYFQIQQVFLNIIINAEFFMTETHKRGLLNITTEKIGKSVRISFADDGPGISPENINRIFDPFFTTKEVGRGTGLGLSICHGIITEHYGTIHAVSEPGKGATFIIDLLCAEPDDWK
jgi:PAS domain S-box-containing protein